MSKITKRSRRRWLAALKMLDDWDGAHDERGENAIPRWLTRRELKGLWNLLADKSRRSKAGEGWRLQL